MDVILIFNSFISIIMLWKSAVCRLVAEIAHTLRVSDLISLTVVAFGTSAPESAATISAAITNNQIFQLVM